MSITSSREEILKFQIDNCDKFLEVWDKVPEENIVERLDVWNTNAFSRNGINPDYPIPLNCGSAACAGGWLTAMDHFRKLGVYPGSIGSPAMKIENVEKLPLDERIAPLLKRRKYEGLKSIPSDVLEDVIFGPGILLFSIRDESESCGTDKEVVTQRFQAQRRLLLDQLLQESSRGN